MISYKVVSLTYDQTYSQILLLNNSIVNNINDTYKLFSCHDKVSNFNLDLESKLFAIIDIKHWYKTNYL